MEPAKAEPDSDRASGIMYLRKGEIYLWMDKKNMWEKQLCRDTKVSGEGGEGGEEASSPGQPPALDSSGKM